MGTINDRRVVCGNAGQPENKGKGPVVIFFHGFGSSGPSMESHVGGFLRSAGFNGVLRFPSGPDEIGRDEHGNTYHSWFEVKDILDNPVPEIIAPRASKAAPDIESYVRRVIAEEGVSADQVVLAGFSQGGTTALYTGLQMKDRLAGIFNLSGGAAYLAPQPASKPLVLMAAGEEEGTYAGITNLEKTEPVFEGYGLNAYFLILAGQGHDISQKSMLVLAQFATTAVSPEKTGIKTAPPSP